MMKASVIAPADGAPPNVRKQTQSIAMLAHIVEHYVANARVFARSLKKIG